MDTTVFIVEGEKDADALAALGMVATTNPGGCGSTKLWGKEPFRAPFKGRNVVILPDADVPGRKHAAHVAASLATVARSVRVLELSGAKDVSDWLAAGHTAEELRAIIEAAPEWTPHTEPVRVDVVEPDAVLPAGPARPARSYALTETGGGELLAARLAGDWHYIPERGKWIRWGGARWGLDVGEVQLMERSKLVAHEFLAEAQAGVKNDDARAKAWAQFGTTAQRRNVRANFVALAKSEPGIAVSFAEFDRDAYLLNCTNGTVNLRTGQLRPHAREDKLTRMLPWPFDPGATCPRWEQFLVEVLPDEETVVFVQRLVGYCLTGEVGEHVIAFLYGRGANGKTVFVNVLLTLAGEYGTQAPTSMLIASQSERHPTELVTLHGRRLVVCAEVPGGKAWNEELLKSVSGGDVISARGMREDFWTFAPTHKLVISGNHKPVVRGQDDGIWRRWRLLPFERTIPEADRDPKLAEKLAAEMPGILAWAVRGCLAWQRDGLRPSSKVLAATADYRTESDRLAPFVAECCAIQEGATVIRSDLFRAYSAWAQAQGERHPLSERAFAELLRGRGIEECWVRANGKQPRAWRGIELVTTGDYSKPPVFPLNGQIAFSGEISRKSGGNVQSPVVTPQDDGEEWP